MHRSVNPVLSSFSGFWTVLRPFEAVASVDNTPQIHLEIASQSLSLVAPE